MATPCEHSSTAAAKGAAPFAARAVATPPDAKRRKASSDSNHSQTSLHSFRVGTQGSTEVDHSVQTIAWGSSPRAAEEHDLAEERKEQELKRENEVQTTLVGPGVPTVMKRRPTSLTRALWPLRCQMTALHGQLPYGHSDAR